MKQFAARARAQEAIFANQCKEDFVLDARGLRRLAEWAVTKMEPEQPDTANRYASALIKSRLEGRDPIKSVEDDLRNAGVSDNEISVSRQFEKLIKEARDAA